MITLLVTALVSPLGIALLVWSLCLLLISSHRRLGLVLGTVGLAWLLVWSMPLASDALRGSIERQAGPRSLAEAPVNVVAVVLGGGISGPHLPERPEPDLGASADRVWHAARLYHAGKTKYLLLNGGSVRTGDGSEAEAMRQFLLDLGVPGSAIWLEQDSQDTIDNAERTAQWLRLRNIARITLVTSGLHMPRARAAFERTGLRVDPAPTDFEVIPMPLDLQSLLPNAGALNGSARAMKEVVGHWLRR